MLAMCIVTCDRCPLFYMALILPVSADREQTPAAKVCLSLLLLQTKPCTSTARVSQLARAAFVLRPTGPWGGWERSAINVLLLGPDGRVQDVL